MKGPFPVGTWTSDSPIPQWSWERDRMVRGERYRVIKSFIDAHGDRHPVGEEWTFIRSMFSKFDGEIIICVRIPPGEEWSISLREHPGPQAEIVDNFLEYVAPVS